MININTTPTLPYQWPIFEFNIQNDILPNDSFFKDEIKWSSYLDTTNKRTPYNSNMHSDSKLIDSITDIFNNDEIINTICKIANDNYVVANTVLPIPPQGTNLYDFLKRITHTVVSIINCPPGSELMPHFDNRNSVGGFILNLIDNKTSTDFLDYRNNNQLIYKSSKKKNAGVIWLNCENTMHSYKNDSNENRIILYSNILFKYE
jgi:hypothetical protein